MNRRDILWGIPSLIMSWFLPPASAKAEASEPALHTITLPDGRIVFEGYSNNCCRLENQPFLNYYDCKTGKLICHKTKRTEEWYDESGSYHREGTEPAISSYYINETHKYWYDHGVLVKSENYYHNLEYHVVSYFEPIGVGQFIVPIKEKTIREYKNCPELMINPIDLTCHS